MQKNPLKEFVELVEKREEVVEDVSVKTSEVSAPEVDPEIV